MLAEEMPSIMAWVINGRESYLQNGVKRPQLVEDAINEYLQGEDTMGHWLDTCCNVAPRLRCKSSVAYDSYRKFIEASGEGVQAMKGFINELEQRGMDRNRMTDGSYIVGMELKPDNWLPV